MCQIRYLCHRMHCGQQLDIFGRCVLRELCKNYLSADLQASHRICTTCVCVLYKMWNQHIAGPQRSIVVAAVQCVLSKKKHVLENKRLHVEAMTPHSPPPVYAGETERNRLIVKGLPFGITLEKLSGFVEREARCEVTGWVLGSKKNSAMLEFDGKPGRKNLHFNYNLVICNVTYNFLVPL